MGLREKRIFLGTLVLLAFVAALYFYQTRATPEIEVYGVSVILSAESENFEKGLTRAALENNADLHIVRVADYSSAAQIAALERELNNGANAVILYRASTQELGAWIAKNMPAAPLVIVGDSPLPGKTASHVPYDIAAISAALVAEMEKQPLRSVTVAEGEGGERLTALLLALDEAGFTYDLVREQDALASVAGMVCAAPDPGASLFLADSAGEGALIYGMGCDAALLGPLESGRITALAIVSEFDAGYLAVTEAVGRIDGKRAANEALGVFIARAENMYEPPLSTILFPIG